MTRAVAACLVLLSFPQLLAAEIDLPPSPSEPVTDLAGILSADVETKLNLALRTLRAGGGSQIAVLTLPEIGGAPIEQLAISVVDRWKLGDREKDNGLLLLVARKERQIRIEVGQGLEDVVPDAYAKRIIDDLMVPLFKKDLFDDGVLLGISEITKLTDPGVNLNAFFEGTDLPRHQTRTKRSVLSDLLLLGFCLVFFLFLAIGRLFGLSPRGSRRTSYWDGLGGGGRGGFGGGFSGGGGGFSGGGASGRW